MAFCKNCGAPLTDQSTFCQNCGAKADGAQGNSGMGTGSSNIGNVFTNSKDHTNEFDRNEVETQKVACGISYLWILFFIPLVAYPNSRYARFHANQALLTLIVSAILGIIAGIVNAVVGGIVGGTFEAALGTALGLNSLPLAIAGIITTILGLCSLALVLFGLINTLMGRSKELPIIGHITIIK